MRKRAQACRVHKAGSRIRAKMIFDAVVMTISMFGYNAALECPDILVVRPASDRAAVRRVCNAPQASVKDSDHAAPMCSYVR